MDEDSPSLTTDISFYINPESTHASPMKLIIQIPCYNEENTIEAVINDLPRKIGHIDTIEILITDDGSTDNTVELRMKIDLNRCQIGHRWRILGGERLLPEIDR